MMVIRHCFSHLIIQTLYIGTKLTYLSIISKNKNPICACECVHVLKVNFVNVLPLFCCVKLVKGKVLIYIIIFYYRQLEVETRKGIRAEVILL